jgi:hypothetical protein
MHYCELQAFLKFYALLQKKKLNAKNIILASILIILGLPIKFLKLLHEFLFKSNESFTEILRSLAFGAYHWNKNLRVEVYNQKIFLNGDKILSLIKIISSILKNDQNAQKNEIYNLVLNIKKTSNNFNNLEKKMFENKKTYFYLAHSTFIKSKTPHFFLLKKIVAFTKALCIQLRIHQILRI